MAGAGHTIAGPGGPLPNVRRIAVLRATALGDFVFALPALDALRAAYPDAEIVLLARDWHAEFLKRRPGPVDRVVALPAIVGDEADPERDPGVRERVLTELRRESFDLAIQIHGGGRNSNPFLLALGAGRTVGLATLDAARLDAWIPYVYYQSEIMRCLEAVGLAGAPPVTLEPRLVVTDADVAESLTAVAHDATPLVVLHPGATDRRRRWPPEFFAEAGDALVRDGCRVALVGIEAERPIVDAVVGAMSCDPLDLSGRLTLSGLAGLLSRADVVIANDSGPLHLAGAVGASTVGIFWCGNLINGGPTTRARHRPQIAWRLDCPECGVDNTRHGRCAHDPSFVADVAVADVLAPARELLA